MDVSGNNNGKVHTDVGFVGLASVGYGFGNGLRLELEGNYRNATSKVSHAQPGCNGCLHGSNEQYGPMVNLLYDFDLGWGNVMPYVGLGVGAQWMHINAAGTSEVSGAAQGIVGVAIPVGMPGLAVTAEARALGWFANADFGRGGKLNAPVNVSGLIGLRYAFGAPAPVEAPAPVPAAREEARTYLVFFDWDKSDLTARARQIIADAASASQRLAVTRIEVAGHADRSGTPQYNQGLSMRRAQTVAAELVRLGVKRDAIAISAFGDTRPLVPTAAGVREPQNRRVEIVLK
jgi:outer membrane protein OmpA-like peptidoglycan-associated protein